VDKKGIGIRYENRREWSKVELTLLKRLYPQRRISELMKRLNRTRSSIQNKAWKLGLKCIGTKPADVDSFNEFELGYLVGIIEGEGCITIQSQGIWKGKKRYYSPVIMVVSNTDREIIEHVLNILRKRNYRAFIVRSGKGKGRRKDWQAVYIKGIAYAYPFLKRITPLLRGKKRRVAELVSRFCELRMSKMHLRNRGRPYTNEEYDIIREVRLLNEAERWVGCVSSG